MNREKGVFENPQCCIFQPTFGGCALQTLVEIVIFRVFNSKKLKKARNLQQNFAKTHFFKFAPKRWLRYTTPQGYYVVGMHVHVTISKRTSTLNMVHIGMCFPHNHNYPTLYRKGEYLALPILALGSFQ